MATFDNEVRKVSEYVAQLRGKGRPAREFACPPAASALADGLPIRVGRGANPRIILRGDTFVELGNPSAGSCAFVVWTDTPSLLSEGRITLIGPDIQEAPGGSLPFAQIVMVGGEELGVEAHQTLAQTQYIGDQIEGYMVRSSSQHLWSRVSTDAAAKGFCFETLGRALMIIFKSSLPQIQAMETVFVTSSKEDVLQLEDLAGQVRESGREIVKEHWKARGFDLDCEFDCRSCHDKKVCTDIRDMLAARRKKAGGTPRRVS